MVFVCDDFGELKLVIRCTATKTALTVEELLLRVVYVFGGGPNCVQLQVFNYLSFNELLKDISDVVQLEDPTSTNSIVNLVSSKLSCHIEHLVNTNIFKPPSEKKNKHFHRDLLVSYRVQCAFIRILREWYLKELTINDFVSDVLCVPIFKSLVYSVDQLFYNLNHIFKRIGMDKITLQLAIVDGVKNITEDDKLSAIDIYNINEASLEDSKYDDKIAKGIKYPLSKMLEESIKSNIELLLEENPNGILERQI